MRKALEGVKVVDITKVIAGPYCGMLLSDMGADVIKVEKKGVGDDGRGWGTWKDGQSLFYAIYNRNKRSVAVDFRNQEGIGIIRELIREADVLVENYRVGTMANMGFDEKSLKELNPKLVVAHISGFGQYGPLKHRIAFDSIVQAMSGLEDLAGQLDGAPQIMGTHMLDYITGLYAAYGIMVALFERERSGLGQEIDCCLLDSGVTVLETNMPDYLVNGIIQTRVGNIDRVAAPTNTYMAKDRYIHINGGAQNVFRRLLKCMDREDLLERFEDPDYRMAHWAEIDEILAKWVSDKEAEYLEKRLTEHDIPCSVVRNVGEVLESEHVKARKLIEYVDYPNGLRLPVPGINVKLSRTPGEVYRRPPHLGEHTEEILRQNLGKNEKEILALKESGVI